MYCPGCGLEEKYANQFCRACGTDLRFVRGSLERADSVTESAATAREEIGRAIAFKIREAKSADKLSTIAEEVLPQIEKFLESPEERRMRRLRDGTIVAAIGAGAAIAFFLVATIVDKGLFIIAGLGLICFFIGLSLIINGLLFSVPKKTLSDKSGEAKRQRELDSQINTNELVLPESDKKFTSVTENTTRQLKEKEFVPRN